jgi:hypothetical protein
MATRAGADADGMTADGADEVVTAATEASVAATVAGDPMRAEDMLAATSILAVPVMAAVTAEDQLLRAAVLAMELV